MKQYAVITESTKQGERAYTILMLDSDRKVYDAVTIYAGIISRVELMRGFLSHIHDLKGGEEALVFTNSVSIKFKSNHIADYDGIKAIYSSKYRYKYGVASYLTSEALKRKGDGLSDGN